jgi:anti-sigma factor RsiW
MNCRGLIVELSTYLDGELDAEGIREMEIHLARCKNCRIIVDTTRKTIDIYCQTEPVPLPEDFATRLHEALARRLGRKPSG